LPLVSPMDVLGLVHAEGEIGLSTNPIAPG
jgi:hypothetical protein